jgi:hypothetical protein
MGCPKGSGKAMPGNEEQRMPLGGEPVACETCVHFLRSPGKEQVGLSETAFWCPAKGERRFSGRAIHCENFKACGECAGEEGRRRGSA